MAAFELVVHHRYRAGTTADLSGYANHGHIIGKSSGADDASQADGIPFDGRTTRVVVFPSATLEDLGAVRVRAHVRVDEFGDRRTIAEGYLAFSFSIEPDASLAGSIYGGTAWHGVTTPAGTVPHHEWVDVSFVYDGRDTMLLSLNGAGLVTRHATLGPVHSIAWPYGLNIGAWPDQDLRMFSGTITEFWLWRSRR